jgi:hypothetical protein
LTSSLAPLNPALQDLFPSQSDVSQDFRIGWLGSEKDVNEFNELISHHIEKRAGIGTFAQWVGNTPPIVSLQWLGLEDLVHQLHAELTRLTDIRVHQQNWDLEEEHHLQQTCWYLNESDETSLHQLHSEYNKCLSTNCDVDSFGGWKEKDKKSHHANSYQNGLKQSIVPMHLQTMDVVIQERQSLLSCGQHVLEEAWLPSISLQLRLYNAKFSRCEFMRRFDCDGNWRRGRSHLILPVRQLISFRRRDVTEKSSCLSASFTTPVKIEWRRSIFSDKVRRVSRDFNTLHRTSNQ